MQHSGTINIVFEEKKCILIWKMCVPLRTANNTCLLSAELDFEYTNTVCHCKQTGEVGAKKIGLVLFVPGRRVQHRLFEKREHLGAALTECGGTHSCIMTECLPGSSQCTG